MKKLLYVFFVGLVITMAFGACGIDEPATEDDANTRGAGAQDSTKGGGIMLYTTWYNGDTIINF